MNVGDVVIPIGRKLLVAGCGRYECAIVANVEPFALVSVEADMIWTQTITPDDVLALCPAAPDIVRRAVERYEKYALNKELNTKSGIELIAEERRRQVEIEGWTSEHDDQHRECELAGAAISYASVAHSQALVGGSGESYGPSDEWTWDIAQWKPSNDPVRNLTKAGALIAAEIDRLLRAESEKRKHYVENF